MRLVKPTNACGQGDASHSEIFPVDNKGGNIAKYKKGKQKIVITWGRKKGERNYCSLEIINYFDKI